jgi:ubiquinol-cytochrome c reductase cytochrome b subunit
MGLSIVTFIFLPLIDKNTRIKNPKVRIIWKNLFWSFIFNFIFLGWLGEQPAEELFVALGQVSTFYYFFFLWVMWPLIGRVETLVLLQQQELKK